MFLQYSRNTWDFQRPCTGTTSGGVPLKRSSVAPPILQQWPINCSCPDFSNILLHLSMNHSLFIGAHLPSAVVGIPSALRPDPADSTPLRSDSNRTLRGIPRFEQRQLPFLPSINRSGFRGSTSATGLLLPYICMHSAELSARLRDIHTERLPFSVQACFGLRKQTRICAPRPGRELPTRSNSAELPYQVPYTYQTPSSVSGSDTAPYSCARAIHLV